MFVPLLALVGLLTGTVTGYVVLADVDVVEAAYWVVSPANVGIYFRDREGPETAAKALSVLSRAGLVVVGLWIGQTVAAALFGGQITEELKRVQQERAIARLSDHVVVCGYGMFGRTIAERLETDQRDVVVVERDEDEIIRAEREGHLAVDGDARLEATLERARAETAGTIVAAVDNSNVNIQVAIVARQLAPEAELIVRVGDELYESTARRAGADTVVIPEVLSGTDVAEQLAR